MSEQQSLTNEGLITAKRYLDWYLRHPEVLPPDAARILGITRQHAWRVRRKAVEALSHKKGPGAARRKQERQGKCKHWSVDVLHGQTSLISNQFSLGTLPVLPGVMLAIGSERSEFLEHITLAVVDVVALKAGVRLELGHAGG